MNLRRIIERVAAGIYDKTRMTDADKYVEMFDGDPHERWRKLQEQIEKAIAGLTEAELAKGYAERVRWNYLDNESNVSGDAWLTVKYYGFQEEAKRKAEKFAAEKIYPYMVLVCEALKGLKKPSRGW
jgi:hypothetical protein